jgi:hypothetical protein
MYVRIQLVLEIQQNCMLTWPIRLLSVGTRKTLMYSAPVKNKVTRDQHIFGTRRTIRNSPGSF